MAPVAASACTSSLVTKLRERVASAPDFAPACAEAAPRPRSAGVVRRPTTATSGRRQRPASATCSSAARRQAHKAHNGIVEFTKSPFAQSQKLYSTDVATRTCRCDAILCGGRVSSRPSTAGRGGEKRFLATATGERGLEYTHGPLGLEAVPKSKPPPLHELLCTVGRELGSELRNLARERKLAEEEQRRQLELREKQRAARKLRELNALSGDPFKVHGRKPGASPAKPPLDIAGKSSSSSSRKKSPPKKKRSKSAAPKRQGKAVVSAAVRNACECLEQYLGVTAATSRQLAVRQKRLQQAQAAACDPGFSWDVLLLRDAFERRQGKVGAAEDKVHVNTLDSLLRGIGVRMDDAQVLQAIRTQSEFEELDWDEFLDFLRKFKDWERYELKRAFEKAAGGQHGVKPQQLGPVELETMLLRLGYSCSRPTLKEILRNTLGDREGRLDFLSFEDVLHHVRGMAGHLERDYLDLRASFVAALGDRDGSALNHSEAARILVFHGYGSDEHAVLDVVSSSGAGEQGERFVSDENREHITWTRLLAMANDLCKADAAKLQLAAGVEKEAFEMEDVYTFLRDIGHSAPAAVAREVLEEVFGAEASGALTLEEFDVFMRCYRRRRGFDAGDVEQLHDVFMEHSLEDAQDEGVLGVIGVCKVLRWLGFQATLQEQQLAIADVVFDTQKVLSFSSFLQLYRRRLDIESRALENAVQSWEAGDAATSSLHVRELPRLFRSVLGCEPETGCLRQAILSMAGEDTTCAFDDALAGSPELEGEAGRIDAADLKELFFEYRGLETKELQALAGFRSHDVAELRGFFDPCSSKGVMEKRLLEPLLRQALGPQVLSKSVLTLLQILVKEVATSSVAALSFEEVLFLLRTLEDARDAQDVLLEERLVFDAEIAPADVDGFRRVFSLEAAEGVLLLDAVQRCVQIALGTNSGSAALTACHGREQARLFAKTAKQEAEALWTSLFQPEALPMSRDSHGVKTAWSEELLPGEEDAAVAVEHLGLRFPEFLLVMQQALAVRRQSGG
eukprot:TRINITY_DN111161_c0_g1_i1.p1 TRINITY_DN111161_c0_g1~~TRINITY_DN111161_c0_g1_i1.p1  ORF type:complete len:1023 (+),score=297.82 TRINITY_DN111161_c0_g1_i1:33-3101(+)